MLEKKIAATARKAKRAAKSASTKAEKFVKEEVDHLRTGLSKAKRAGVKLEKKVAKRVKSLRKRSDR